jgi:sortase A
MAVTAQAPAAVAPDGPEPGRRGWSWARAIGSVGRLLVTSGVVLLLLVAYQLWGTNLQTHRAQRELRKEFQQALDADAGVIRASTTTTAPSPSSSTPATAPPKTAPPKTAPRIPPPAIGDVVGRLTIPSIGVHNFYFVEGTGLDQLKRGAAHYPETPLPGQAGNAAIAGHRTTWGAPFHNIDKIQKGDIIEVTTLQGTFRYRMFEQLIVAPTDVSVLDDVGDNRLTLTACHPKLSSKQRIVIHATLVGNPVEKLAGQDERPTTGTKAEPAETRSAIDDFESAPITRFPGAWWGIVCVLGWIATRVVAWTQRANGLARRALPYLIGTPICLVLLYLFFESVSYEAVTRVLHL